LFALAAMGLAVAGPDTVKANGVKSLVVVVNTGNADPKVKNNTIQLSDIKNYFLRETSKWADDDKTEVKLYPMVSSTDEAKFFLRKALGKSEDELAKHWNKKKENDGIDQPKGRKDNAEVFRLVSKATETGAIGYLDKVYYDALGEDDKKKVKAIYTISDS
jgi:hypothetical protein